MGAHGQGRILTVVCHRNGFGSKSLQKQLVSSRHLKELVLFFKDGFVEVREFFVDEGSPVGDI